MRFFVHDAKCSKRKSDFEGGKNGKKIKQTTKNRKKNFFSVYCCKSGIRDYDGTDSEKSICSSAKV